MNKYIVAMPIEDGIYIEMVEAEHMQKEKDEVAFFCRSEMDGQDNMDIVAVFRNYEYAAKIA